jgi:hypothetical protein
MEAIGNPHTVYNGAVSGQRNMFLSSSLAIVIAGFSHNFKNKNIAIFVKILAFIIFTISIYIGFTSTYDFRFYLDHVKEKLPNYVPIENWYRMGYIVYAYTFIITLIGGLYFVRNIV